MLRSLNILPVSRNRSKSWHLGSNWEKQRQIDATDKEIDGLVYELYGLTEEEIQIVEGG